MDESGDKSKAPFLGNGKALVTQLLQISENSHEEKSDKDALCGWDPFICCIPKEECQKTGSEKYQGPKTSKGNNALQWREVVHLRSIQNTKKKDVPPKKKRPKFHVKRIEELSHPKKIRDKVALNSHTKLIVPFNNRQPLNPAIYFDNKLFAMTKVALRYGETGPELGQLSQVFQPTFRSENTRSAHERRTERSGRELSPEKQVHSAGTMKKSNFKRAEDPLPSILVKTRANAGSDWEELSFGSDVADEVITENSTNEIYNVDLPLPQAKLSNLKANKLPRYPEWAVAFPPLPRSSKKQRALGSITAITQGNINAGIKTNSIRKIRRAAMPQTTVILPKLSGSKVEVPLLPQSPDFLHRLM